MSDTGAILKRSCDLILSDPLLRPEYDNDGKLLRTHCNQGARLVAQAMACREFDDINVTADGMLEIMRANASGRWEIGSGADATIHALSGLLAIAGADSTALKEAHGHVTVIYPVGMQHSNAAGKDVPMCANVGPGDPSSPLVNSGRTGIRSRANWLCSIAWAFPVKRLGEPVYYLFA